MTNLPDEIQPLDGETPEQYVERMKQRPSYRSLIERFGDPLDEVFTFYHPPRWNFSINTTRLRRLCEQVNAYVIEIEWDHEFMKVIREARGVEQSKLDRMTEEHALKPILACEMPDKSFLTVDGHHRMVWLYERGYPFYKGILIPYAVWRLHAINNPKEPSPSFMKADTSSVFKQLVDKRNK